MGVVFVCFCVGVVGGCFGCVVWCDGFGGWVGVGVVVLGVVWVGLLVGFWCVCGGVCCCGFGGGGW
ncbi:hypothetical protein, partial [Pseudomonas syringae group genomosp. 7]